MSATETMRSIESLFRKHEKQSPEMFYAIKAPERKAVEPVAPKAPKPPKEVKNFAKPVPPTPEELEALATLAWRQAIKSMEGHDAALWAYEQAKAFLSVRNVYRKDLNRPPL